MTGWIKLHRSLLEWEWYEDINATRLLIHLLISVNYVDKKWRGEEIKAGSMVLSWSTLSKGTGLTVRQARSAMDKLEASGEVTRNVTNKYQVVSLVKWEKLQGDIEKADKQNAIKRADKWQTNDRQATTTKESKEYKEIKEIENTREQNFSKYSAYDLIQKEKPTSLQAFEMQKKKLVPDWKKLLENFENKIELELARNEIKFEAEELFPRFKGYVNTWIENEQKSRENQPKIHAPEDPSRNIPIG
ncbi:hypothetical protein C7S20_19355 [Christiangramia fulva]|uniref:Uncharacterized protein n=1 Tax=Christiangramia fulva TaxID=2126553 RepID=A0A2R3ZAI8_9FLAO|nr:hypothetical protein [Christiangramia fulva]AVR47234.1 hypothetical protein C7S20_19355 [Christiangramia fulva]